MGPKNVGVLELAIEFEKVVNFTVERNPHAAVFIAQRLLSRSQIDDAQPPMTKSEALADVATRLVWPAMTLDVRHFLDDRLARRPSVKINESSYSTHSP